MKEQGLVKCIKNGIAHIELIPPDKCVGCKACGAHIPRIIKLPVPEKNSLEAGSSVIISMNSLSMLKIYLLLYFMPLTVFVGTIFILYPVSGKNPLLSLAGALSATLLTYLFISIFLSAKSDLMPKISKDGSDGCPGSPRSVHTAM